jgi:hypothetical protein
MYTFCSLAKGVGGVHAFNTQWTMAIVFATEHKPGHETQRFVNTRLIQELLKFESLTEWLV